jgi:hypothetical protein
MKVLRDTGMELETTTHAVLAAHEGSGWDAIESVSWERRGLLQRLVRIDVRESVDTTSDVPMAA